MLHPSRKDGFVYVDLGGSEFMLKREQLPLLLSLWKSSCANPTEFVGLYGESVYFIPKDIYSMIDMTREALLLQIENDKEYKTDCMIHNEEL